MLKIYFGEMPGEIYNPPLYFANQYEDDWITSQLSVDMIKDIDKSTVISARAIDSPVLGGISPLQLSGGVKTLILMAFDETGKVFNASAGGDNCAKWIVRISEEKELTISLHNIMSFEGIDFKAQILNDGRIVNNYSEYLDAATDFLQG
ncbi:MAG: DUF4869 domain-containing protein [Oscillospiraceae bacterium]|nr:DUF4869 domain-containing protein [Oscillospiraceae bacterium]